MADITTNPLRIARRFIGMKEAPGVASNPSILSMLQLDQKWPQGDDVPWCSAFVNYVCWVLGVRRSMDLRARSWLRVGNIITLAQAEPGFDVVIFSRGNGPQPGPEVIDAPGHVAFFEGFAAKGRIMVVGGNQGDSVSRAEYPVANVIGVRRLQPEARP